MHSLAWFRSPNKELYRPCGPFRCCTRTGKLIHSFAYCQYSTYYPGHLVSLTRKHKQLQSSFYHFIWIRSQASNLIWLFSAHNTPHSNLRDQAVASLKDRLWEPAPHPPKDISSGHVQKPKLSWFVKTCLCQNESIKSGRGDHLLKYTDTK